MSSGSGRTRDECGHTAIPLRLAHCGATLALLPGGHYA